MRRCLVCPVDGRVLALDVRTWRCPCGSPLDLSPAAGRAPDPPGAAWRWAGAVDLVGRGSWSTLTLGEGGTPLVTPDPATPELHAKLEHLMPTGSFKDRGAVVLVGLARALGARRVVADSSGNAGVAIAAYASRAGLPAEVFVPGSVSAAKLAQLRAHGATVSVVDGDRESVADAAVHAVASDAEAFYASHAWHPAFLEGTKTMALELWEQLGRRPPDEVVLPVGNGTLLLGAARGFAELAAAGLIDRPPRLIAVQAAACAPLAEAWREGLDRPAPVPTSPTLAEGIAIASPPRGSQILAAVAATGGRVLAVDEDEIATAHRRLARLGLAVEPTSAATYAGALRQLAEEPGAATVVLALCGAGWKSPPPEGSPVPRKVR